MPDLEIIEKHISSFIEDLDNLKKYKNVTIDKIKSDKDLIGCLTFRSFYLLLKITVISK